MLFHLEGMAGLRRVDVTLTDCWREATSGTTAVCKSKSFQGLAPMPLDYFGLRVVDGTLSVDKRGISYCRTINSFMAVTV